mmetsp:Transcript_8007/g.18068  ORF Transcript_8007/g.18068 Transcript_8007/m.18068 type:complete len:100 (+) Transcript_8007:1-300(+)
MERNVAAGIGSVGNKGVDYKMKEGEKIRVSIPKIPDEGSGEDDFSPSNSAGGNLTQLPQSTAAKRREERKARQASSGSNAASGGFLRASSKDTPSRLAK